MITSERLQLALEFNEWLNSAVYDLSLPATNRSSASAGCFAIVQDHHHAIIVLAHHRLYASIFSLVRLEFEAYIRGAWLLHCASNDQVDCFLSDLEPPNIGKLIKDLEKIPEFSGTVLSRIKKQSWASMCSYTHAGGLHIQRWQALDAIQPNYGPDEVNEVLCFAEFFAAMSGIGLAQLASDDSLAQRIFDKVQEKYAK